MTLAQRITAWTSKGILTAVIVVAGLGFGRQVLRWWANDRGETSRATSEMAVDSAVDSVDESPARLLQFGTLKWSIGWRPVSGTREDAARALQRACQELIPRAKLPDDAPGPSETRLLATLAARPPVAEQAGQWRLDALDEGLPMVVGTRPGAPVGTAPEETRAAGASRVVLWGLALPASPQSWTLYTCVSGVRPVGPDTTTLDIPPPPDSIKILSISTENGGHMETFSGRVDWVVWRDFYEHALPKWGWRRVGDWEETVAGGHGRFRSAQSDRAGTVDIHMATDGRSRTTGLLLIAPGDKGAAKE
ncbi:MAG: hypothetical protein NTW96_20785 [Planctomycetia bacterium]|nr:hypothetical protein [Planctomycetia bacterium]